MNKKITDQMQKMHPDRFKGIVKGVWTSINPVEDYRGEKEYRSVYAVGELDTLWIDVRVFNRKIGEAPWRGMLNIRLFRLDGQQPQCIVEKEGEIKFRIDEDHTICTYAVTREELLGLEWEEGVYRVIADIDGMPGQSEEIYVIQGTGRPEDYFQLLKVGLDRICNETVAEARMRPHSFQVFNVQGLKNISFFLMAQNLLREEWIYEFVLRVLDCHGRTKALEVAKACHFMQDEAGNHLLCFGIDLGGKRDFKLPGEYMLIVTCFGQVVLNMGFAIGEEDVPYNFAQEMLSGGDEPEAKEEAPLAYSAKDREEIMDRLYRLVGLRKVKEEITQIMDYAEFVCLRRKSGFSDRFPMMHLMFTGQPGTGKNTVAEMVGQLYCKLGLLSNGKVNHYKRQDLIQEGAAIEEQQLRQALQKSKGGIMFIDQAGDLFRTQDRKDRGVVILSMLCSILTSEEPEVLVILSDKEEEMNILLEAMPNLKKVFSRLLCFEKYTPEELMEIARYKLEKMEYRFTPAAEEKFYKQLKVACVANEVDFTNGRYIDEQLEAAAMCLSRRLMANRNGEYNKDDLMLITEEDIVTLPEADPSKSLEKLEAMVGLGQLKHSIAQHLNYVYFIRERQKHGFADVMPPLNMIFSGNPGTGKMTVAKMMGEIYYNLGILLRPNVVRQDSRALTSEWGLTPQQAAAGLLNLADGGLLYLQHVDVLLQNEWGLALFESLLMYLSTEECDGTVVVLGGYPDRMAKMLERNPNLKSYFPYVFQFNDYTPEELMEIAVDKLKAKNYTFHPKAREVFGELIRKAYENRNQNFGNVLLVEKIVDMSIRNMSERTMKIRQERELTRQEITTIRKEDIPVNIFNMPRPVQDVFDEEGIRLALAELDQLVGQPGIKQQIRDFVELARHYSREGIKLSSRLSLQWCFTGNSAMGKGTVARIIARLYKAMGIITNGHVLDFKVERMIGLMEDEAQRSIGEALARSNGGVLLFDEDSPKLNEAVGFRERVRAILMTQMAERPGSYLIIYAEPRERVAALNGDAEHATELLNVLVFEDYTKEELMVILKRRLDKERMKLTTTARQYMLSFIDSLVSTEERSHASSRLMRIVADMIVRNCLQRVAKKQESKQPDEVISVQKQDVAMFTENFVAGIMKERKRIGFV